jgi:hypothetical protein
MTKIWTATISWIKSNWKWLLVVPVVVIFLSQAWKSFIRPIWDRYRKPADVDAANAELGRETTTIKNEAGKKIDKLEGEKNDMKTGIDAGSPTPADVFNRIIGKVKK